MYGWEPWTSNGYGMDRHVPSSSYHNLSAAGILQRNPLWLAASVSCSSRPVSSPWTMKHSSTAASVCDGGLVCIETRHAHNGKPTAAGCAPPSYHVTNLYCTSSACVRRTPYLREWSVLPDHRLPYLAASNADKGISRWLLLMKLVQ